jgi:hypothetical protein
MGGQGPAAATAKASAFPQEFDRRRTIPGASNWSMADSLAEPLYHKRLPCPLIPPDHVRWLVPF